MNPTWQRGFQLDQLTTVFTGMRMGVQGRSRYFLIYFDNLQRMIGISVSTRQLPAIHATFQSSSVVEVGSELSFCIFRITESQKGGAE